MLENEGQPADVEPKETAATVEIPQLDEPAEPNDQEPGEPRQTRRERRAARVDVESARREADEYKRSLETERQERERLAREVAEMRGYLQHQQSQQADPFDGQIQKLREKAEKHLEAAASAANQEASRRELRAYQETQEEIGELKAERRAQGLVQKQLQEQPNAEEQAIKVSIASEFPWVIHNAKARQTADGYRWAMLGQGKPDTLATFRAACAMAAKDHGLGGNGTATTDKQRAAYSGVHGGEAGGSNGSESRRLEWSEDYAVMAQAAYPHLDPAKAKAEWLKNAGPKILARLKKSA